MSRASPGIASTDPSRSGRPRRENGALQSSEAPRDVSEELKSLQLSSRDRWGKPGRWFRRSVILLIVAGLAAFVLLDKGQRASAMLAQVAEYSNAGETVNKFLASLSNETTSEVRTVRVQARDRQLLNATGFIEVPNLVHLSAEIPGTVVELPVDEGMTVQQGDLCIRLEDARYQAELDQAKAVLDGAMARLKELQAGPRTAEVDQAKAKLDGARAQRGIAEKTLDRENRLLGTNAKAQHEQAKASLLQAQAEERLAVHALESIEQGVRPEQIEAGEAEVKQAESALAQARYNHEHAQIFAPQAGTILERNVELGQYVRGAVPGESLFILADLTQLTAVVAVSERDLSLVEIGQACEITTEAYPDRSFQGRVDRLSVAINRQRGIREVNVEILDTDETLLPEMNCSVRFLRKIDPEDDTVIVPRQCLAGTENDIHVFVLDENQRARKRLVQLGNSSDDEELVEIKQGLTEGELAIIIDGFELEEGQEVTTTSQ